MSEPVQLQLKAMSRFAVDTIVANIHRVTRVEELHLDPVEFYEKFDEQGRGDIRFPHYEIELVVLPQTFSDNKARLYIHDSNEGKPFVCYPQTIPSLETAKEVLTIFFLGSVATLQQNADVNAIYDEVRGDFEKFQELVKFRHGIWLRQ